MLDMPTIQSIRARRAKGEKLSEIAAHETVSVPTVRKCLAIKDFSPALPVRKERPSILDPYKDAIEGYLDEDERSWHKQRHTAKRIWERLVEEHNAEVGYTTVQLYVKRRREERKTAKGQYLKLVWAPGEVQVDFGEADFIIYGKKRRVHYLVADFPFSNVGLSQVFYGENAECVCQGLPDIFSYIGGVPTRLVLDNATGVGRRIGDEIRTSELFGRFACHFGFEFSLCNPRSEHEKGAVENKVGAMRRSMFVPTPRIYDIESYNKRLLDMCMERSDKDHYAKGESERALFMEDVLALGEFPENAFSAVAFATMKCDKCGHICLEGNHRYAAGPAFAKRAVIVGKRAFDVDIYTEGGELVRTHKRACGKASSSSDDLLPQLNVLCMKPAGWQNPQARHSLPEDLRGIVDKMERSEGGDALRCLRDIAQDVGYDAAVEAMGSCVRLLGETDRSSVEVMAACAASDSRPVIYDDPADLDVYDVVYAKGGETRGLPS